MDEFGYPKQPEVSSIPPKTGEKSERAADSEKVFWT
jgi:hypothetical protein